MTDSGHPVIYTPTLADILDGFNKSIQLIEKFISEGVTDQEHLDYIFSNRKYLQSAKEWQMVKENITDFSTWDEAIETASTYLTAHSHTPSDWIEKLTFSDPGSNSNPS